VTLPEWEEGAVSDPLLGKLAMAREEGIRYCDESDRLRREADSLSGRLTLLREQLSGVDEDAVRRAFTENMQTVEGRIASGMDAQKLQTAKNQLEEYKEQLREAEGQYHAMETALAAKRAVSVSPTALADEISQLDERIEELTLQHEAYCLAMETMERASDRMRAGVLPKVVAQACASANRISGGKFEAIGIDQGLDMTFTRDGHTRGVEYLSEGTKDVAYISLRRALTGALFGDVRPPLIYDESFARVDEGRLRRVLTMLSSQTEEGMQSIVLTCRRLEAEIAGESGGANLIRLS